MEDKKIAVQGVHPSIDGEYDFVTIDEWNHDEWHRVKTLTGLVFGDFLEADEAQKFDMDVIYAMAVVACDRDGRVPKPERFLKLAKIGQIILPTVETVEETEEDDAGPPELANATEPVSPESNGESADDSGQSTNPHAVPSGLLPYLVSTGDQH